MEILALDDICCSRTFGAFDHVEAYPFSLLERLKALCFDSSVMYEDILATILLDKTKTF